MSIVEIDKESITDQQLAGLERLKEKFAENLIGKLPKPTKAQTDAVKKDWQTGIRCDLCGGWHNPKVVHLDYVGHAAVTSRFLEVDPFWNWEPFAVDQAGLPTLDAGNGMWIRLTICGVTRIGYGDAGSKRGGDAIKEAIGDALRNAAMRFGVALDLWHKGDLHFNDEPPEKPRSRKAPISDERLTKAIQAINDKQYEKQELLNRFDLTDEQYQKLDEVLNP